MREGPGRFEIRPVVDSDRDWVRQFIRERWGSDRMVSRGRLWYPGEMDGFIASIGPRRIGLSTFRLEEDECELMTIDALDEGKGVGTALLEAVRKKARNAGSKRVWLITTNDHAHALRFYQKNGFRLVKLYPNALEQSRKLKPEIPLVGIDGIILRDEIELEFRFAK